MDIIPVREELLIVNMNNGIKSRRSDQTFLGGCRVKRTQKSLMITSRKSVLAADFRVQLVGLNVERERFRRKVSASSDSG